MKNPPRHAQGANADSERYDFMKPVAAAA